MAPRNCSSVWFDRMSYTPLAAEVALEWFLASGERTEARLRSLVEHFCQVRGETDPVAIEAAFKRAMTAAASKLIPA